LPTGFARVLPDGFCSVQADGFCSTGFARRVLLIHVLPAGEKVEWKEYWASWMEKK
jgi:hypothetical protein